MFPPENEETQLPVIICAPVFRGNDLDKPLRVWPDCWDSSVSVMHGESDPGMALLSPDTVRGEEIALHPLEEDCRTNTFSVLSLHISDPSGEMGLMDNGGLAICPQDSRFSFSDGRWCDDMLCLLHFSSPENSVELPVVGGPDWMGLNHWQGIVWDPGIMGIPRLRLCYNCLCLISKFVPRCSVVRARPG